MVSGEGSIDRLGELAKELGFSRTLLVADAGLVKAGHLEHARASLEAAAVDTIEFSDFGPNPDADMLEAGRRHAAGKRIDSIIGLGGGSSLDCAKGINFLLTQGGAIHDFQGYGKAMKPMLPMIGVPTTAGTGSEAQSYAIISDPRTHKKMACGDPKAAFRAVILDPRLTLTQPPVCDGGGRLRRHRPRRRKLRVHEAHRAIAGAVARGMAAARGELRARPCGARRSRRARRDAARCVSRRDGDRALDAGCDARVREPGDRALRHHTRQRHRDSAAARRPLERQRRRRRCTQNCCVPAHPTHPLHPFAPNAPNAPIAPIAPDAPSAALAVRLSALAAAGDLPKTLRDAGASSGDLAALASEAAGQWTGTFNPRPFDANGALEIYQCAF